MKKAKACHLQKGWLNFFENQSKIWIFKIFFFTLEQEKEDAMVPVPYYPGMILVSIITLCIIFKVDVWEIVGKIMEYVFVSLVAIAISPFMILLLIPRKYLRRFDAWVAKRESVLASPENPANKFVLSIAPNRRYFCAVKLCTYGTHQRGRHPSLTLAWFLRLNGKRTRYEKTDNHFSADRCFRLLYPFRSSSRLGAQMADILDGGEDARSQPGGII